MDSGLKLSGIMACSAIVISNDAPTLVKTAARLAKVVFGARIQICDGIADDVEINAAITAAAGGSTHLSAGGFDTIATINCTTLCVGEGEQYAGTNATIIRPAAAVNPGIQINQLGRLRECEVLSADGAARVTVEILGEALFLYRKNILHNVQITQDDHTAGSVGLRLRAPAGTYIQSCTLGHVQVFGHEICSHFIADGAGSYINDVHIDYLTAFHGVKLLVMENNGGTSVEGNSFGYVAFEPFGAGTTYGLRAIGAVYTNMFPNVFFWDWNLTTGDSIEFSATSGRNYIRGKLDRDTIDDQGVNNDIEDQYRHGNVLIVNPIPGRGSFTNLTSAISYCNDAASDNRYKIYVYGDHTLSSTPEFKSYVDVIGVGLVRITVDSTVACRVAGLTDGSIEGIHFKANDADSKQFGLYLDGATDITYRLIDVIFDAINDAQAGSNYMASSGTGPYCERVSFQPTTTVTVSIALELTGTGTPVFRHCRCISSSTNSDALYNSGTGAWRWEGGYVEAVRWAINNQSTVANSLFEIRGAWMKGTYCIRHLGGGGKLSQDLFPDCVMSGSVSEVLGTKTISLGINGDGDTVLTVHGTYNPVIMFSDAVERYWTLGFKCPDDFMAFTKAEMVWNSLPAAGNIYWNMQAGYGTAGEAYNTHTDTPALGVTATGGVNIRNVQEPANPLTMASLAPGDRGGIYIHRDATNVLDTLDQAIWVEDVIMTYVGFKQF